MQHTDLEAYYAQVVPGCCTFKTRESTAPARYTVTIGDRVATVACSHCGRGLFYVCIGQGDQKSWVLLRND